MCDGCEQILMKQVDSLKDERDKLLLQIRAWQEYAAFLGVEVGNLSLFAAVHGWKCPLETVAKGSELRRKLGVNDDWTLIEKRSVSGQNNEA